MGKSARGPAGPAAPTPPRFSRPRPARGWPGSARAGRPVAAASSGQLAGRGGAAAFRRAPSRASLQAGRVRVRRECECVPGVGGRNKEPSKHGESVSSKAHKYSSRVLISPTHTHTRARAHAATLPGLRPPSDRAQTTIAKTTFANCTVGLHRGVGAEGVGITHSHSHTHTYRASARRSPLWDPRPADPAREERHWVPGPVLPIPQTVQDCTKRRGRRRGGSPRESVHTHSPHPWGSRLKGGGFSSSARPATKRTPGSGPPDPRTPGPRGRQPRPPTWWRASSTASASGRLCSSISATWAALCAHFGPGSQELRGSAGIGTDAGRSGLWMVRGGRGWTRAPSPRAEKGGRGSGERRERKAAARPLNSLGSPASCAEFRGCGRGTRRMAPPAPGPGAGSPLQPLHSGCGAAGTIFPPARAWISLGPRQSCASARC